IERLGQVVVGADLEADDAVDVLNLGGQHDDRRHVVGGAQTTADRQAVFARQHEVEHDQVDRLAGEDAVQRLGVFGQQGLEPFLGEVAAQEIPDARVVVDHDDAVGSSVGGRIHLQLHICNSGILPGENPPEPRKPTVCYIYFGLCFRFRDVEHGEL